ncbi:aminoglycoside phosphotransferase [Intrasporangium oryzae NRRL B-24470]|uniref:Aminoglycoside phosphotransferase n=1 Tax=Intrasporangium oryzae NRRL B-24470 TaxID=1386089 RepID=W9G5R3_9MICO|nr:aminoglycoside phosphotransferase [Intrasporangium oryzae NRRL B-24470]
MLRPEDAGAVATAFGLHHEARLEGPVARGQLGQVWRLSLDGSEVDDVAVKEWFAGPGVDAIERDAAFAESVRAAGVLTPKVIRTPDGEASVHVRGTLVRAWEWVDLRPRDRGLDPEKVGVLAAALHRAGRPSTDGVPAWFATGVGERSWRQLHARVVAAGAPFAGELGALLSDLVAVESVVEPHESPITAHRDLWADNVLATTDGRVCVIDFENMGPADPSQELAMLLFEFGLDDPARARRLHTAYIEAGGPGRVTRRGHFTMLVAQQAHIAQLACSRWIGTDDEAERRRLASWFLETPDDPVTLARIDRILAAVT